MRGVRVTHLDRTGVNDPLLPTQTLRDRILSHDRLSSTRMRRDQDALASLDGGDRDFLERVEFERVGSGGGVVKLVLRDWGVGVGRGDGDSMSDLKPVHRK